MIIIYVDFISLLLLVLEKEIMLNKLSCILVVLTCLNCTTSKEFVSINIEDSRLKLVKNIENKRVYAYKDGGDLLFKSDSVVVVEDSLYYFNNSSNSVSLYDINYIKTQSSTNRSTILAGLVITGIGIVHGNRASDDADTFGESLGGAYEGATLISLGLGTSFIGLLVNTNRYYFLKEVTE